MTNSKRTKRNISKELMFNKIMPSYRSDSYNEYYGHSQNGEVRNPRSEPDKFKISEKVLAGMEDRPLVPDPIRPQPVQNQFQQNVQPNGMYQNSPYQQGYGEYQQSPAQAQQMQGQYGGVQQQGQNQFVQNQVIDEDKPKYINITEEILYSKLTNMIAMFKCCNCEKCRQTVMLSVLNSVKAEYVYKRPSEVKEMIESNSYADINQPIIRAILDTKSNPPHKR